MELSKIPISKLDQRIHSTSQQCQSPFHWWIVLPIIIVSMTATTTDPILINDLLIRRYRIAYGLANKSSPSSETACNSENIPNNSQIIQLSIEVQKSVSNLNIIMAGIGAVPAVLTYIILGANCDQIGRKPLLILPCLGKIIRFIILMLVVQFNLSDIWFIISNAIDGLFGSNSVLLLGAIAYITDCTNEKQRSRAMLLEEAAVALTRIFPLLGLGYWLLKHDYILPISINLGLNIGAVIYIFIFQPESRGENNRNNIFIFLKQLKQIRLASIHGIYEVFLIKRRGNDQQSIILLTITQIMLFIVLFGFISIHPLYLYGKPLCFNILDLAILTSAQFSLMIFISIILSFYEIRLMNSFLLPLLGTFLYIVHLILFGLANTIWFLYLAVSIGCLFFVIMAVLRSALTKLVNETEFALVFIATGIVETLGAYILGIVTNAIYARTIQIYPGMIFFILAGICLIPFGINGFLFIWPWHQRRKAVTVINRNEIERRTITNCENSIIETDV